MICCRSDILSLLLLASSPLWSQAQYFNVQSGDCASNGYSFVTDWHHCKQGIVDIGMLAQPSNPKYMTSLVRPQGCFLSTDLSINTNTASTYNCDSTYPCVCFLGPTCTNTAGSIANSGPCTCGQMKCVPSTGYYCFLSLSLCSRSSAFVLISRGNCEDVANRKPIFTTSDCDFAAGVLSLLDTSSQMNVHGSNNLPTGCYMNHGFSGTGLTINPARESIFRCTAANECLCQLGSACSNTDGTVVNGVPCICGATFCTTTTGLYCDTTSERGGHGQCATATNGPWILGSTTTCDAVGGVHARSIADCRDFGLKYSLPSTIPRASFDTNQTTGCYFNQNDELFFNSNHGSTVGCGEYGATCLCSTGVPTCDDGYGMSLSSGTQCQCGSSLCTAATTGMYCYARSSTCVHKGDTQIQTMDVNLFTSAFGQ